jgi:catechol 2,3-dioxygenase-like lactoylglutathione lyase family enzyme
MKRFHVHVAVNDLQASIGFYSTLFGAAPTVLKDDYAKWMLEEPRVNFAISLRDSTAGVNHLGFQVDDAAELEEIHGRLQQAGTSVAQEENVACCYARSDKYWVTDPAGVAWESFRSLGTVPFYGDAEQQAVKACETTQAAATPCCEPREVHEARAGCC